MARPDSLPALSVVVVSRHRPAALARCLTALSLQDHPDMEVVLVADPSGIGACPDLPIRRIPFDRANISEARNLGVANAARAVVAFIDDDSAAEPGWASALAGAFADPAVIAATGPVRGPDGVNWQARAEWLTADGPSPLSDHATRLWQPAKGGTLSTLGTNCAFRREALAAIGGFDPAFAYHLDESDLNLRLAGAFPDAPTAFIAEAQVIHAAQSGTARAGGAPSDLTQIGRSEAIFARRHGASTGWEDRLRARQRARLIRAMLAGRLDPLRLPRIMRSLEAGLAEGRLMTPPRPQPLTLTPPGFAALPTQPRAHVILSGWHWQARRLRARAAQARATGATVSLMLWTPSFLPHREAFTDSGWWERRGGIWGPGAPDEPPVMFTLRQARMRQLELFWANIRSGSRNR